MSTQPVPTFPLMAGFEKYATMSCPEIAEEYIKNNPDVLGLPERNMENEISAEKSIEMDSELLPNLRDFISVTEEYARNLEIPYQKRNAILLFRHDLWRKKIDSLSENF